MADPQPRDSGASMRAVGEMASAGWALVIAIVLGAAGGYFLDKLFGTSPWLFFLGFFFGVAAGILGLYRAVSASSRGNSSTRPS